MTIGVGFKFSGIQNVNGARIAKYLRESGAGEGVNWPAPEEFFKACRCVMRRDGLKHAIRIPEHVTEAGAADACRILQHRLEDGL